MSRNSEKKASNLVLGIYKRHAGKRNYVHLCMDFEKSGYNSGGPNWSATAFSLSDLTAHEESIKLLPETVTAND